MIFNNKIDIERTYGQGHWDNDGKFAGGDVVRTKVAASVQPATGKQAHLLPSGRRIEDSLLVFTESALFTALISPNKKADIVLWNNRRYEVWNVKKWDVPAFSHYEVLILGETK